MAINFKPFEELFAPAYQLTYISIDGHIDVGLNTYSVFHYYTMQERKVIFQVCKKHLPWEYTQEQEQWERTMYMYQFIIKSPLPFPYSEYPLSEEIIMAIKWRTKISVLDEKRGNVRITLEKIDEDNTDPQNIKVTILNTCTILDGYIDTSGHKQQVIRELKRQYQEQKRKEKEKEEIIGTFDSDLIDAAQTWEVS